MSVSAFVYSSFVQTLEASRIYSIPMLENLLNLPQSQNYNWSRLTFLNKDLQFKEGLNEFFRVPRFIFKFRTFYHSYNCHFFMRCLFVMFVTAVCFLFLHNIFIFSKLPRLPKNSNGPPTSFLGSLILPTPGVSKEGGKITGSPSSLYESHKQHNMASNYKGLYGIFYKISMKIVKLVVSPDSLPNEVKNPGLKCTHGHKSTAEFKGKGWSFISIL